MILIVGQAVQKLHTKKFNSWQLFADDLTKLGIEKETLDCAFVYCLRICGNLSQMKGETVNQFI
jgi:hypothetical protein